MEGEGDDRRSDDRPPVRGRKRRAAGVLVGAPAARVVCRAVEPAICPYRYS